MDVNELVQKLEKDYLLIKKGKWWYFLGGAFTFMVVSGLVSYAAAINALESSTAKAVTAEIVKMKDEAAKNIEIISEIALNAKKLGELLTSLENLSNDVAQLKKDVEQGDPWQECGSDIKIVTKETDKYEYGLFRQGAFRRVTASEWNGGWRVMTEPYMVGDYSSDTPGLRFKLGGSMWIWDTPDEIDDKGIFHMYYYDTKDGILG
ncbi:MAG: hypothetical protein HY788_15970 [Deltaproteobacteria bacterium]|nr:hypothetical protein [Deltaproteobacteria bacterium]